MVQLSDFLFSVIFRKIFTFYRILFFVLGSINLLCVPLGCVFSGMIAQPIGKRMAMQIVNIPIIMSWLLFHFSTSIYHLYAALCLAGLSGGLMEAAVLTYVAEITQPQYRGMLAASGSTCVILGVFTQVIFFGWDI